MEILIHILIALSSVAYTTALYLAPSNTKLRISYTLVVLTVASGSYLVFSTPAYMLHTCIAGLIYTAVTLAGIILARNKLASVTELTK